LLSTAVLWFFALSIAFAHGIAGNRYFPGTITFDDPAVADEFSFATNSYKRTDTLNPQKDSGSAISAARLLSPTWAFGFDYEKDVTNPSGTASAYTKKDDVYLKTNLYRDDLNEELVSVLLGYGYSHTDLPGFGVISRLSALPEVSFGKGFGNLGDDWSWLRPFAFAGAVAVDMPVQRSTTIYGANLNNQNIVNERTQNTSVVHWGFALEYSTLFLTNRFLHGHLPDDEPLHQFVPIVEFAFESSALQKTTGTMNPGLTYVEQTWQLAGELIMPLNQGPTRVTGFRGQLMFFLDDLVPSLFEKPLLFN